MDKIMKKLLPSLIALTLASPSFASVQPVNLVEYITPQQDFVVTEVFNTTDSTAFIRVEAEEVMDYQGENTDRRKINEVEGDNIAVVPPKFITPAGSQSSVKVYFADGREIDRLYRLKYVPVRGKERAEFAGGEDSKEEMAAAVGIDLVFSQGLLVPKMNPTYSYSINNYNGEVIAKNTGDSYFRVRGMNKCNSDGKCIAMGDSTLFSDSQKVLIELEQGEYFTAELDVAGDIQKIRAKYSDKLIAEKK
ncbi:hypothetical protein PBPRB1978 [Photobacterium profundum SS9]|uniref:Pili assembly chaperone N-terminal domain-containing protein n=2 Tax=Photobacterium profundum TaxID=74109 RepID=Q6LFV7_PHOPR|nr:hypothetical protein PBPRB1978 [Photobacterium profundum SS9]